MSKTLKISDQVPLSFQVIRSQTLYLKTASFNSQRAFNSVTDPRANLWISKVCLHVPGLSSLWRCLICMGQCGKGAEPPGKSAPCAERTPRQSRELFSFGWVTKKVPGITVPGSVFHKPQGLHTHLFLEQNERPCLPWAPFGLLTLHFSYFSFGGVLGSWSWNQK